MDNQLAWLNRSQVITGSLSNSYKVPYDVFTAPAFGRALKSIALELRAPLANLLVMIEPLKAYSGLHDLTMTAHEAWQVRDAAVAFSCRSSRFLSVSRHCR